MQHDRLDPTRLRRLIVKVGSSLVVDCGRLRRRWLESLAADIVGLRAKGLDVAIVSSGAVGIGRLGAGHARATLADRQAAAAIGQIRLAEAYRRALAMHGIEAAQVLLTPGDTEDRRRHLNARATLEALLRRGAVPVINENDTVATDELKFGDNDRLAARVAQLLSADLLVVLSDVDGLYDRDPRRHPKARHIPVVEAITGEIEAMAGKADGGSLGTGGMVSKLAAARIALAGGTTMAIAHGHALGALRSFMEGGRATLFLPSVAPLTARKAWIAATVMPKGKVILDSGAVRAVRSGRSVLAVGVRTVEGRFDRGDPVRLVDERDAALGIGLANYGDREAARIAGHRSGRIAALLGYPGPETLIHRDNLVLERDDVPLGEE